MYNLDLRFAVPALLNLILSFLQHLQEKPWLPSLPNFNMNDWNSWFFANVLLIPFLITSVKLPLSVTAEHIQVRTGDFSFLLAITLFSSVFLPQLIFCIPVLIITCIVQNHQQDERESDSPPQIVVVADDDIGGNPILLEQPTARRA
ncbi:hypothetical protein RHSIM_Rhsim05G0046400 [Rhododendron simsii]|uniref:Uncharacterized protein n=1 Tax=Rhododendron simsii TaxID=118357 RepID=A0A834L452_RHOSS|nr:hypothetical protein RHSIM_RhsimUnG0140900 [Rhododendron simsii]KAF7143401.1 hypothetical protein RHSIM_Rhsim05G0046400 [Rhododendron simsii]